MKHKKALIFSGIMFPVGFLAGFVTGLSTYGDWTPQILELIESQITKDQYYLIFALQGAFYAVVLGYFGFLLSEKCGLMRDFRPRKKPMAVSAALGILSGLFLCLDRVTFARWIPAVAQTYTKGAISPVKLFSGILYGGTVEEIILRLFLMSLLSLGIWKLSAGAKTGKPISARVFVAANLVTAVLFAAGHIPATAALFSQVSPLLLMRCFILNIPLGIVYGFVYRTYGIPYAMAAHALTHVFYEGIFLLIL